jgi:hypothetical protein
MRFPGSILLVLPGLLACGAPPPGGPAPEPAAGPAAGGIPARITPAWYVARFPNCIDSCDDPARTALWLEIRDRPDLREALIQVIESPSTDAWTRSNAILRLGATGQESAYRFIRDRLERLPPDDPDAHEWVLAMGSGLGPWPDLVYETLAAQLIVPYRSEATIFILGSMGTERARAILEETARTTGDRELQQSIWRALRGMEDHGRP